jgi:hypothetical protein
VPDALWVLSLVLVLLLGLVLGSLLETAAALAMLVVAALAYTLR